MDAAWIGVIGTLSGVVLGGGLGFVSDSSRWRRQQSVRWHDDRRRAYSRLLTAADTFQQAAQQLGRSPGEDADLMVTRRSVDEARAALQDSLNEVELIAGPAVRNATGSLKTSLERLFEEARERPADPPSEAFYKEQVDRAMQDYVSTFIAFKDTARLELGVDGGS